jgi:glycerol-3-phosphate cytidylyltransferase-like family protein
MAKAKCKICGNTLDTNVAYKVTDKNGKNKYFCSASEFEAEETRKKKVQEDKDRVYRLICDIMGVNEVLNTALWKEKLEWNKAFSDEFIAQYLEEKKDYLTSAIARLSGTEYAKIRYISTVLKNSLRDFKPKVIEVAPPKVVTEEHYETKYRPKARQALCDFEEDC